MRKQNLLVLWAILFSAGCLAQNGGYSKVNKLLNVGIGVNSYYSGGIPIGASLEFGVSDDISIGPNVDYLSSKYTYYGYKFTALYFGIRGSYHANNALGIDNNNVDLYGGATLGYRKFGWSDFDYDYFDNYGSGIYLGAYIGGKYYFSKSAGVFAELGAIGSTNARVGVGFKF